MLSASLLLESLNLSVAQTSAGAVSPCDVAALQKCLETNQGNREKCAKEIAAFQTACSKPKPVSEAHQR